jgi:hypothetical protein
MSAGRKSTPLMSRNRIRTLLCCGLCCIYYSASYLFAVDIVETYPAGLDQPRINATLRRTPTGAPIVANFGGGVTTINIQAFFDTGASGVLMSDQTATFLGIQKTRFPANTGPLVVFSDVGVGGTEDFNVSEPVYVGLAPFRDLLATEDPNYFENPANYTHQFGPIQMQLAAPATNPLLEGLEVFGMPLFANKVVVIDPKPTDPNSNPDLGTMRTFVYNPGTPFNPSTTTTNPGIPSVTQQIKLSYGDFGQFTQVTPVAAPGPTLAHNPFIGPNPVLQLLPSPPVDNTPPVTLQFGNRSTTASILLDTGAAASMISKAKAAQVGVRYKSGTEGTSNPILEAFDPSNPSAPATSIAEQFTLQIAGVGPNVRTVAGFYLENYLIKSEQGNPNDVGDPNHLRYYGAPVLVNDITVVNPTTNQPLTLDGILGTNMLSGNALIDVNSPTNPFLALANGAFNWIVFDEPNGKLGVQTKSEFQANQWNQTGSGTWGTTGNWTQALIPTTNSNDALLGTKLTVNGTVDLGSTNRTVSGLRFDNAVASYNVTSTTGKLILQNASGNAVLANLISNTRNHTISAPVELQSNTTVWAEGETITISGALTFANNTGLNVQSGVLNLASASAATVGTGVTANIASGATLQVSGSSNSLNSSVNVTNAGTLSVTGTAQSVGNISGAGSTTVSGAGTSATPTLIAKDIDQTALTINNGAYVRIAASGTSTSVLTSLTLGTTANLNISDNDVIVNNANATAAASSLAAVAARVNAGFASGNGIVTNTFTTNLETVGFALNDFLGFSTFNGATVNSNSVLIKYTYFGDSNLDGFVTDDDLGYFLAGYGTDVSANPWAFGDYNHDGFTTDDDLGFFLAAYGSTPGLATSGIQAIPEPSTLVLGMFAGLGLGVLSLRRRHRLLK